MQQIFIGGLPLAAAHRADVEKFRRVVKQYLHIKFSVFGKPGQGAAAGQDALVVFQHPLSNESKPVLTIPTTDIVGDLARVRKMNKHRFIRWLQRQPGWKGLDLTGRKL